jgi:hypothetical protein
VVGKRRERIAFGFDAFHQAIAAVLGAAAQLRDRAALRHAEAMVEMWLRQDGLDAARSDPGLRGVLGNPRLQDVIARVAADRDAAFDDWCAPAAGRMSGPDRLVALTARYGPGAAGDADGWLGRVSSVGGEGPVPQLWRIGAGALGTSGVPAAQTGFPVAVPLLDESHLQITSTHETRAAAEAVVESLLLRVVSYFRPGVVQLHVWDIGQFTGSLPGLYPLTRTGLLTVHDPADLAGLLDELSDRIRKVHTRVLVGGHPSLKALAEQTGERAEPWVVAVILGNRSALGEDDQRQLQRVLRGGLAAGVSLVLLDVPLTIGAPVETVRFRPADATPPDDVLATTSMTGPYVTMTPDPPLPRAAVTNACHAVVEEHERLRTRVGTFDDLLPPEEEWCTEKSTAGLFAPIGFVEGLPATIGLGDATPHALIGGPSGTGKTNLLLTMIASMAVRYSPQELAFYLLDFKEGVSFAQFAPGSWDTTWLPHAKLVGVNVNTDREFGLALLQHLADEMRRRAQAAKALEVTKLEELRKEDTGGEWPRIVAVIDEFQYLFAERDGVTRQATQLLEDLARRGRSHGIHLVLASQDVSSIEAFWGRPAIIEQFVLRIGLPRARRVLAEKNDATLGLPRWHAVVNPESGISHGNEIVRLPDVTGRVREVQERLHKRYGSDVEPRLFDGSRTPRVDELLPPGEQRGHSRRTGPPRALVGQRMDVDGTAATVPLPSVPGRNIGVVGADSEDAMRILDAIATSLLAHHEMGPGDVLLAPLVAGAVPVAERLAARVGSGVEIVRLNEFAGRLETLAELVVDRSSSGQRRPLYLFLYAGDAADAVLDRDGTNRLRQVLRFGPEAGVHTIGWWRSPQRLRQLLSASASPDDIGAFLGLDVQGSELGPLIAPGLQLAWSPRPGRALFFDRSRHAQPEVLIVPAFPADPRSTA